MNVFSMEELRSLLVATTQENEKLMAEEYQRMFDELFNVIKTQYDAEFEIEDIPNRLS